MEQQISGEEFRQMSVSSQPPKSPHKHTVTIPILWVIVVIVVGVLCFFVGDHVGKDHAAKSASTVAAKKGSFGGGFGGAGRGESGAFGTVSSVSSSSITIQNERTDASDTYAITSSTQITDDGQTVSVSDIQTGDTVVITKSSSSASTASKILVNPSFGGGGQASSGQASSGTDN